jgi:hypothetical protein
MSNYQLGPFSLSSLVDWPSLQVWHSVGHFVVEGFSSIRSSGLSVDPVLYFPNTKRLPHSVLCLRSPLFQILKVYFPIQ